MTFNAVENFQNKIFFYSVYKKFLVAQNYFPISSKLNKINVQKKVKPISTFNFSILYTTIPDKLLLNVLSEVIDLTFKSKIRKHIAFSKEISIGPLRKLKEDTSLNKLLSMLCHFS